MYRKINSKQMYMKRCDTIEVNFIRPVCKRIAIQSNSLFQSRLAVKTPVSEEHFCSTAPPPPSHRL